MYRYIFVHGDVVYMICCIQSAFFVTRCEARASRFREPTAVVEEEENVILVHKAVPSKISAQSHTLIMHSLCSKETRGLFLLPNEFR